MAPLLQLAPMQAMTDMHFMNTYHKIFGGFNEMMAPYLMASGNSPMKAQNIQKHFAALNTNIKLVPQLLSNDADGFLYFANVMYDLGYEKVNWNLGCPFPYITRKLRGAGLLLYPDKIDEILEKISVSLKPQLSVKIRLGMHRQHEVLPIIEVLNRYPVAELILHPRTADQKYEGTADREFFGQIYRQLNMPVIYNGDIKTNAEVEVMQSDFPNLKGYMIGRGAFINPFITNQIHGIMDDEKVKTQKYRQLYFDLHNYYKEHYESEARFLGRMKDLWFYFSQSFYKGESYLFALKTINDVTFFEEVVNKIFNTGQLKY